METTVNEKAIRKITDIYQEEDIGGIKFNFPAVQKAAIIIGIIVTGLSIYEVFFGNFEPALQRPLHILLMCSLTFITMSSNLFHNKKIESWFNILLIALTVSSCIWASLNWKKLYFNPNLDIAGIFFGAVCILLVLEATRRAVGLPMTVIGLFFVLYALLGPYLPVFFAHGGFSIKDIIVHLVVGTEGMMGLLLSISVNQIIFFMLFAAFLIISNSTNLFMEFSKAIAGQYHGGPAKVAVVSSGLMGMVSGSASGNVATTGSITIPLMISMGFKNHVAGAIEAVASTAGQFMPPIMGAAAFIIAEYTGNTYGKICLAALIPSLIYFLSMFLVVDLQARKRGLKGLPKDQLPGKMSSFKKIIPLIIPLVILVFYLALQYSVQFSILLSLAALILIAIPSKVIKIGIREILMAFSLAGKLLIPIATSCATAGIIVGIMSLTGLGEKLSYGILTVANGNLFIGLLFTAMMSIIIGMGLPTLGAYVVLAALGAPALVQLGSSLLGAHLFIFYFAILSAITPPVSLAAFVAAGIAKANPMKVGYTSVILAPFIYIIPFMFVYNPGILMEGDGITILTGITKIFLIIFPIALLSRLFWLIRLNIIEILLAVGSIISILFFKNTGIFVSMILQSALIVMHLLRTKKKGVINEPKIS